MNNELTTVTIGEGVHCVAPYQDCDCGTCHKIPART